MHRVVGAELGHATGQLARDGAGDEGAHQVIDAEELGGVRGDDTDDNQETEFRARCLRQHPERPFLPANVIPLTIPPLRDRKEDIPLLVDHLLERLAIETGKRIEEVSDEAMARVLAHDWPGNVRELRNILERGMVLAHGAVLRPEHLGDLGGGHAAAANPLSLEDMERRHVATVLRQAGGNVSQAARVLGIDRATLYAKIRKYDLKREDEQEAADHR